LVFEVENNPDHPGTATQITNRYHRAVHVTSRHYAKGRTTEDIMSIGYLIRTKCVATIIFMSNANRRLNAANAPQSTAPK